MHRQTRQGRQIGPQEALSFQLAYDLWTGSLLQPAEARRLKPGELADLCLWNRSWSEIRNAPENTQAQLTIKAGEIIYRDGL